MRYEERVERWRSEEEELGMKHCGGKGDALCIRCAAAVWLTWSKAGETPGSHRTASSAGGATGLGRCNRSVLPTARRGGRPPSLCMSSTGSATEKYRTCRRVIATAVLLLVAALGYRLTPAFRSTYVVGFCTVPDDTVGERIVDALVSRHLAACVNSVRGVESAYWWEGKVERSSENLLIVKTQSSLTGQVTEAIRELHPYDVPEVDRAPPSPSEGGCVGERTDWGATGVCPRRRPHHLAVQGGRQWRRSHHSAVRENWLVAPLTDAAVAERSPGHRLARLRYLLALEHPATYAAGGGGGAGYAVDAVGAGRRLCPFALSGRVEVGAQGRPRLLCQGGAGSASGPTGG
eukprot:ctg_266.g119